jgi:hypothetical protein
MAKRRIFLIKINGELKKNKKSFAECRRKMYICDEVANNRSKTIPYLNLNYINL